MTERKRVIAVCAGGGTCMKGGRKMEYFYTRKTEYFYTNVDRRFYVKNGIAPDDFFLKLRREGKTSEVASQETEKKMVEAYAELEAEKEAYVRKVCPFFMED